jgi:hypothetical protein
MSSSTGDGTAFILWGDQTLTIVNYQSSDFFTTFAFTGDVIASATLPLAHPLPNGPTTGTVTTTRWLGTTFAGAAAMTYNPADCAGGGVTGGALQGAIGFAKNG